MSVSVECECEINEVIRWLLPRSWNGCGKIEPMRECSAWKVRSEVLEMLRLAHRIISSDPWKMFGWNEQMAKSCGLTPQKAVPLLNKLIIPVINWIKESPVIIADGIDSLFGESPKDFSDFPGVRIPFEKVFIESSFPESGIQSGCMCREYSRGSNGFEYACDLVADTEKDPFKFFTTVGTQPKSVCERLHEYEHCIRMWHFISTKGHSYYSGAKSIYFTDHIGTIIHSVIFFDVVCQDYENVKILGHSLFSNAIAAASIANCRNVIMHDATRLSGPSDKWLRRQKQPKLRYHVLDINPMKEVLRTEGNIGENGIKKALHICRGHFKHYNGKVGPFGRHIDEPMTFWCPSHVKGDIKHGAVIKDYEVKTNG